MQASVPKSGKSKKSAMMVLLAAAIGVMLHVAVERAEARKGGNFKSTTTGTIKPPPGRAVRDHRGQPQPRLQCRPYYGSCRPGFGHKDKGWGSGKVRDHRSGVCTGKACK